MSDEMIHGWRQRIATIPLWGATTASLVLFTISLAFPALEFESHEPVRGITLLFWGWWGVLTGDFPWFANPIYFCAVACAFMGKRSMSGTLGCIALVIGLLSLVADDWYPNEANSIAIKHLGPAFYLWIASFGLLAILMFSDRERRSGDSVAIK